MAMSVSKRRFLSSSRSFSPWSGPTTFHARIHALVKPVLELPGLSLPGKPIVLNALDRFAATGRKLSFVDLYVALDAQSRGITESYSWAKDFDRIEGITRVEPSSDLS